MGAVREQMEDEAYLSLLLMYGDPVDFMTLVMTPMTGWSIRNAYFDGIKYCGSLAQNPYNMMNVGFDNFMEEGEEIPEEFKRESRYYKPKPKPQWLEQPRWIEY